MLIKKFEDIEAWQEAKTLTILIYDITNKARFSKDWGMKDQIQRASVSIMNNIGNCNRIMILFWFPGILFDVKMIEELTPS